jgi:hypothetical protein
MKNIEKIITKKAVIAFLLVVFFCSLCSSAVFEDVSFSFSSGNTRTKTFRDANATITKISMLGYNTERLQDILDEAISYEEDKDFLKVMDGFQTTFNLLNTLRKKAYLESVEIDAMKLQNISVKDVSDQLGEAEADIVNGKYEDASILLEKISDSLKTMESSLQVSIENKFNTINSELSNVSGDEEILSDLGKQVSSLKTDGSMDEKRIKSLNLVIEEISQLEKSSVYINGLNNFSKDIKSLGVTSTEAEDILSQVYYFIKEKQYEKALSLLEESQAMIESEKKARGSIKDAQEEIAALPESDKKNAVLLEFDKVKEQYLSGSFDDAKRNTDSIVKEISDINSELILSQSVNKDSFSIAQFIKENIWLFIIISGCPVLLWLIFRGQIKRVILKKRIMHYEAKKDSVYNIMKGLQERYYVQKNISKLSYERQIRQTELRYADIVKELALMKDKLK